MSKGFTKFYNIILEALIGADISCTDIKVILAIIRYTYGYSKDECMITAPYLAKITGKSLRSIKYSLNKLCDMGILEKRESHKNNIQLYKITSVDKWKGCNILHHHSAEDCTTAVQRIAPNKDNNININNYIYKNREGRTWVPTPKATAFSNFESTADKIDYKKLEMDALMRRIKMNSS